MSTKVRLSLENHLERDPRLNVWNRYGLGGFTEATETWVSEILRYEIPSCYPGVMQEQFDRARACIVYGCYYYPLFTLGVEELCRFYETALNEFLSKVGSSKSTMRKSFKEKVTWMENNQHFDEQTADRWRSIVGLRNAASHKSSCTTLPPNLALHQLSIAVELIDDLFFPTET